MRRRNEPRRTIPPTPRARPALGPRRDRRMRRRVDRLSRGIARRDGEVVVTAPDALVILTPNAWLASRRRALSKVRADLEAARSTHGRAAGEHARAETGRRVDQLSREVRALEREIARLA